MYAASPCSTADHSISAAGVYTQSHHCGHTDTGFYPIAPATGRPTQPTSVGWSFKSDAGFGSNGGYFILKGGSNIVMFFYVSGGVPGSTPGSGGAVQFNGGNALGLGTWYDVMNTIDWSAKTNTIQFRVSGAASWQAAVTRSFRKTIAATIDRISMYNYAAGITVDYKDIWTRP